MKEKEKKMAADDVKIREKFCWSEEEAKKKKRKELKTGRVKCIPKQNSESVRKIQKNRTGQTKQKETCERRGRDITNIAGTGKRKMKM